MRSGVALNEAVKNGFIVLVVLLAQLLHASINGVPSEPSHVVRAWVNRRLLIDNDALHVTSI